MPIADRLYPYQVPVVDFAASRAGALVACEQGTGKTYILAALIERLAASRGASTHLVIAPLANVDTTWARVLALLDGVSVHRSWASFRDARDEPHRVLLVHYELFRGNVVRAIIKRSWTSVAFDESQRLKSRGSKASRAAARFREVDHRVALSGTPIEQAPEDLWAQLRFTSPDVLGRSWSDFTDEWMKPSGFMGYDWKFRRERLDDFIARVRPHIYRVTQREVLDLPPLTRVTERVPLLGEQARIYRELDRHQVATLVDGQQVVCDMAITELVRLQQVTGGFIRTSDGSTVVVGAAKARRLAVVLRREHRRWGQVVVFCKYKQELDTCAEVARRAIPGCRVDFIRGMRGSRERKRAARVAVIDRFQAGEIDVLVCQVRAGGVGIDLYSACVEVWYSLPHSSIEFDQGVTRVLRNGQTRPVRVVVIEAANTVDTLIARALLSKRTVSQKVLEDHRRIKMAKDKEPAKAKDAKPAEDKKKPTPPPQPPKPKYGVPELAQEMGVKPTSLRVKLRSAGIPKNGKLYGWDTKEQMKAVVDKLKASANAKASKAKAKSKDADDEDGDEDGDDE